MVLQATSVDGEDKLLMGRLCKQLGGSVAAKNADAATVTHIVIIPTSMRIVSIATVMRVPAGPASSILPARDYVLYYFHRMYACRRYVPYSYMSPAPYCEYTTLLYVAGR